jgi:hypothetical protein
MLGWKIGITSKAMQQQFGFTNPSSAVSCTAHRQGMSGRCGGPCDFWLCGGSSRARIGGKVGRCAMSFPVDRRRFLSGSAALLTCSIPLDRSAQAAPARIGVPLIDTLVIREITDGTHDVFLRGANYPGLLSPS